MSLDTIILRRRAFLTGAGATALAAGLPRLVLADAPTEKRFVLIILRGAMDGLNVVPPYGDRSYAALRAQIAIATPGETDGAIDLDGFFGLHPALAGIAPWYREGALLPIHAVASPYRDRSHFDGQDLLENGVLSPRDTQSGWLNRALTALGGGSGGNRRIGLAVGQTIPLVLRGPTQVASWAPSHMPEVNDGFLALVQAVYRNDRLLSAALADGIRAAAAADKAVGTAEPMNHVLMANDGMGAAEDGKPNRYKAQIALADGAGRMLADPNGARIAAFDAQGWDTHAAQGGAKGRLANALGGLQATLLALRAALGPAWKDTIVLMATEFGRTAHVNGTNGTDHGTGTATLLAGGAVAGGKVLAEWPGLIETQLYQSRDLQPTIDLRAVIKTVLYAHLGVPHDRLDGFVFPNSGDARMLKGVIA
jgi:uncharacterized protein (DUF1501 family)